MADAVFTRWPAEAELTVAGARNLIGSSNGAPLISLIEPAEAATFATAADGALDLSPAPDGAMRYVLEQLSDTGPASEPYGVIMLVAFDIPAERADEVDRWYDEEHIGLLMKADGWLRARRYRVLRHEGGPRWTSMAFHQLRDQSVMDSPERAFARSTAWRAELERDAWFRKAGRGVFGLLR